MIEFIKDKFLLVHIIEILNICLVGLSNCTHLKELYLGGNKICEIEGLHKLVKLHVLDLHSNKLASTKSISQLAANWGSLTVLNLLGNPIFSNISEDHLRKLLRTLTPHLLYLNKRPIRGSLARDGGALDQVVKATHRHFKKSKSTIKGGVSSRFHNSNIFAHSHNGKASLVTSTRGRSKHHHHHSHGHGHGYGQHHQGVAIVWENDIATICSFLTWHWIVFKA